MKTPLPFNKNGMNTIGRAEVDLLELPNLYPIKRLYGKGSGRRGNAKSNGILEMAIKSKLVRQGHQQYCELITWPYELAEIANPKTVIKRSEMDERVAAMRNISIKSLGLYWRRAPY
jgi:hypothetical protein